MSSLNKPGGNYLPVISHGGLAYVSGQLPRRGEDLLYAGKVGADVDLAAAQEAAALCADLCLAAVNHATGGEDRIVQVLQIVGYVASAPGFTQQSQVMNGASDRLIARDASTGEHVELFALAQNQGKPCRAPCRAPCPCTCAAPCTVAHVAHGTA